MTAPGDKCWVWNINSRVYDSKGMMLPSGHFKETTIDGETRQSWIVGPYKFDKETLRWRNKDWGHHMRLFLSQTSVDDYIFIETHRHRIADAVRNSNDPVALRACAAALGYEAKP